jgi:hypothetical protein
MRSRRPSCTIPAGLQDPPLSKRRRSRERPAKVAATYAPPPDTKVTAASNRLSLTVQAKQAFAHERLCAPSVGYGAGVRPWWRMMSASLTRSGGAGSDLDHRGRLAKILRPDRGGRDGTEGLHVLAADVVEPVNGAPRNAQGLPWPDVHPLAIHGPSQHGASNRSTKFENVRNSFEVPIRQPSKT